LAELHAIKASESPSRAQDVLRSQWSQANLRWHFVMDEDFDYEPSPDKSITAVAEASGVSNAEALYDTMNMFGGYGMTWRPLESYANGDLESMRTWLETYDVIPGISDAGS
jgi:N-acyl-D-amino-acid deacylase